MTTIQNTYYRINIEDGIAIITLNMVDYPTNLFVFDFVFSYLEDAKKLTEDPSIKGIVITSDKKDFMAGADINAFLKLPENKEDYLNLFLNFHKGFRELEISGKPIVAAINGHTLGGGFELVLTCHHRIALEGKYLIGLPETQLGIFPGAGGTQRLPRLIGLQAALSVILQAQKLSPKQALEQGLIDELAQSKEDLIEKAKNWILNNPQAIQPWDSKKPIHQDEINTTSGYNIMMGSIGAIYKKTHDNFPGIRYALSSIYDGLQIPIDKALEVEARYFTKAVYSPEAINMIRTLFFYVNDARKGKNKPEGYDFYKVNKLGILGAGMMGAGIAYVSAKAGMDVVLKDTSLENAEKGKSYSEKLLERVKDENYKNSILNKIKPTTSYEDLENSDLIIEAVFEDPQLKAEVTKDAEEQLKEDKIYGTNTSTLPITSLAKASKRPENFIGIHFFSPVDKMPLVELIVGRETSKKTLANAIDYVSQINKVPIVVNDSHGFFTSRVFATYTSEGALLVKDGACPTKIENLAKKAGMAVGPLAVSDEVTISLMHNIMEYFEYKPQHVLDLMDFYQKFMDLGRIGKKVGKGFYDYPVGEKKTLWKELSEIYPTNNDFPEEEISKRLMHIMALESFRCLEEKVLNNTKDGDIGSILGLGFAPHTGGVFSYIDFVGIQNFVRDCDEFADKYGSRWKISDKLRSLSESKFKFYDGIKDNYANR